MRTNFSATRAGYQLQEARLNILEGSPAAALELLREVDTFGGLSWVWFEDPIIRRLAGDPAFIALKASVDEHIDAERAKLGWPPAGESE